jgi:hypothetical protein
VVGTRYSRLAVALFAICLAATSATSDEAREAREAGETADDAGSGVDDRVFPVPNRPRSRSPEGVEVELDSLLRLPSGFGSATPRAVAGAGESEWRRRFAKADRELSEARTSLNETKRELDEVAVDGGSSQWSIAPPGASGGDASPGTSPLSFKLRQQLREDRDRIDTTKRALRELRIEADLAGVPKAWREVNPSPPESSRTRQELD